MGRGNWMPYDPDKRGYRLVYVELPGSLEEIEDVDQFTMDMQDMWEELKDFMYNTLPKSFLIAEDTYGVGSEYAYSRDTNPLFANGLFTLCVDDQGDCHHQGIALVVRQDAPEFAAHWLDQIADRLFDAMVKLWKLSVRCGPWISTPYKRPEEVA